jgi:hypothetical protein
MIATRALFASLQVASLVVLAYAPFCESESLRWGAVALLCTGLRPDWTFRIALPGDFGAFSALTQLECAVLRVAPEERYPRGWFDAAWRALFLEAPHRAVVAFVHTFAPIGVVALSLASPLGVQIGAPLRALSARLGAAKHAALGTTPNDAMPIWDPRWFVIFFAIYWIFSISLSLVLTHCSAARGPYDAKAEADTTAESSTSTLSAKVPRGLVTYLRLSNRLLASLVMFSVPIWIFFFQDDRRVDYFNPWIAGHYGDATDWAAPKHAVSGKPFAISLLETRLIQFQFMYYIVDTPLTLCVASIARVALELRCASL